MLNTKIFLIKGVALFIVLFLYGCASDNQTKVTILDFIDQNGERITEDITFSINGKEAVWISGNAITINLPMKQDYGFVEIEVFADNYKMNESNARFQIVKYEGLELVITLEAKLLTENIAYLKIREIIDNNNNLVEENISLKVNNNLQTWTSDADLVIEVPTIEGINIAIVEIVTDGFNLMSQDSYLVVENETKEVSLIVERIVDEPVARVQPIVQYGTANIDLRPTNAEITVTGPDTSFTLRTSQTIRLKTGRYQWVASHANHNSLSGQFRITANSTERLRVELEPITLKGNLSAQLSPANTNISILNISSNDTYNLRSGETLSLDVGNYKYTLTLEGYSTIEGNIEVLNNQIAIISHTLEPVSAVNLIRDLRGTNTIIRAINLFPSIPRTAPSMPATLRFDYYDALVDYGVFLFRGGEQTMAMEIFELILEQDLNNYRARIQYAVYLNQRPGVRDHERIREVLRPLFGQLLNMVPADERLIFDYRARFLHAESYYYQFSDTGNRNFGARAIAEFEDVIRRFDSLPQAARDDLNQTQRRAISLRDNLRTDLGI